MNEQKILELIPESMHPQLFIEVAQVLEAKRKAEQQLEDKKKAEVSPMMQDYLKSEKEQKERDAEFQKKQSKY